MPDKLKQISQNAGLVDDFEKKPKFAPGIISVNKAAVDDANKTPVELCVAQTLSSWREMEQKPPEPSQINVDSVGSQDSEKAKSEEFHSDTNSSPIIASESISPSSPHNDSNFGQVGANRPNVFSTEISSYPAVESTFMVPIGPKASDGHHYENGEKMDTVPHFREISVLTNNDQQARLICQNGRFSSFSDFITAFDAWRQTFFHPFRVASSEALREPNNGAVDETFKYRYIVYHCAFYGNPRKRGNGKRPNQNYMPCGCEAMLRLNFNHNEHCLKITTLRDVHKGHAVSADSFRRISTKIRRISPAGSLHSGGEMSPSSLRSDSSQAVKSQLNSPNTSACSIGLVDPNDSSLNSILSPSDSKPQRRPYRQRKSIKSIGQKPESRENSYGQQQPFQDGQDLQDPFPRAQCFQGQGFQGQDDLGYVVRSSSSSAAESIELSLMAAASAMSVKASPVAGGPLSSSSKSSQSYFSDSRLLLHPMDGPASQGHGIYSSASSGSSIMSAGGLAKVAHDDQKPPTGHSSSLGYLYQQPPYGQVHLEMPPASGSAASGGSAASSASFSTNLLSPHTPSMSSSSAEDVNNVNRFDKDLTTRLLLSLLDESNRSSRLPAGPFPGAEPSDPNGMLGKNGAHSNGNGILSPSALLSLLGGQTLAHASFRPSAGSAPYSQLPTTPMSVGIGSGLQSQPLYTSEAASNLESRQQELLSAIFSKIVNQTQPPIQPQVAAGPTSAGLSTFGPGELSNLLLSLSSGQTSTDDNVGLNLSAISATCQPATVSDSNNVKNTVAKVQEILSNPAYANVTPNVLALMLSAAVAPKAVSQPAAIQLGQAPQSQPPSDAQLYLALHNSQLLNRQNDRPSQPSLLRQPTYGTAQDSLIQQLFALQEKDRPNATTKCLGPTSYPQLQSPANRLLGSSGPTTLGGVRSLVHSSQACADGEVILQRLRDRLYAVDEPTAFVSNLRRLSEFLVAADKT